MPSYCVTVKPHEKGSMMHYPDLYLESDSVFASDLEELVRDYAEDYAGRAEVIIYELKEVYRAR